MDELKQISLPKGCEFIVLPEIRDERGALSFGESMKHIPFDVKRVFWTYEIAEGQTRGNHAHKTCSMVLFPLGGSFKLELEDLHDKVEVMMDKPHVGVLIPPGVWCRLYDFTEHATCVSLASEPYAAEDYLHDYVEFKKQQ